MSRTPTDISKRPSAERGFSLLELMVAVSLLSLAVIPLLVNQGNAMRNAARLEERALAALVAENAMHELVSRDRKPNDRLTGRQSQGGIMFTYRLKAETDRRTDMTKLTINVKRRGARGVLASLIGYHADTK